MKEVTYESAIVAMQRSDLESMAQDWIIEKLKKLQSLESAEQKMNPTSGDAPE